MQYFSKLSQSEKERTLNLILKVENKFNFSFPPKFLHIITTYKVGIYVRNENTSFHLNRYLECSNLWRFYLNPKKQNDFYPITYIALISLFDIISRLEDLIDGGFFEDLEYKTILKGINAENKIIPIGQTSAEGQLYLGVGNKNKDKIYICFVNDFSTFAEIFSDYFELLEHSYHTIEPEAKGFEKKLLCGFWKEEAFSFNKDVIKSLDNLNYQNKTFVSADNLVKKINIIINDLQSKII